MRVTLQIANPNNDIAQVKAWLRFNGTDYPNSAHYISLQPRKSNGDPNEAVLTFGFTGQSLNPNDFVEIYWESDSDNVFLNYVPLTGQNPNAGSVYVSVNNVAEVVTGTSGTSGITPSEMIITYHAVDYNTDVTSANLQEKFVKIPSSFSGVWDLTGITSSYGAAAVSYNLPFTIYSEANFTPSQIASYNHPANQQQHEITITPVNVAGTIIKMDAAIQGAEFPKGYTVSLIFEPSI